jgi:hypothetical protein
MYCILYAKLTFGPGCQAVARQAECFGKYTGTRVPTNGMAVLLRYRDSNPAKFS